MCIRDRVQGFGLGVMNARAAYFAKRDARFASFLTEGRSFGPHGTGLTIANSIEHYEMCIRDSIRSGGTTDRPGSCLVWGCPCSFC